MTTYRPDFSDLSAAAIAYMLGDESRAYLVVPAEAAGPSDEDLYDPVEDAVYEESSWYWDDDGNLRCADCHGYLGDADPSRCRRCDRESV